MKKILLIMVLCVAGFTAGCPLSGGGCGVDYCCVNGQAYTPFTAFYPDGYVYNGSIGINNVGTYSLRGYNCSQISVLTGSNFGFGLSASPSSVDLNAPPAVFTITGQGMSGTYGLPKVEYFNNYGFLIGSVTATAVAGDGTWVQANTPDLSSVYSGTYQIRVTNMRSDGYYLELVGSAAIDAWGRDAPPDDGGGGDGGGGVCGGPRPCTY